MAGKKRRPLTGAGDWAGHMQTLPIDPLLATGKGILTNFQLPGGPLFALVVAKRLFPELLKKYGNKLTPVSREVSSAIHKRRIEVPSISTTKEFTKVVAEASKRTTKLPAKPSTKPSPLKLPGSFGKGGWSAGPPKSNVVPLPRSQNTRVNNFMKKLDPKSEDYQVLKAVTRARTELGKRPSGRDNVIDFKPKTKKARGGGIKKGYARGGGIRKPKW